MNLHNRRHHSDKFIPIGIFFILVTFSGLLAGQVYTDIDTVNVPGDISPAGGNLNNAVDTVISQGKLSNTVFQLNLNSRYVLTRAITVPAGEQLTIIAPEPGITQETAPPQILWTVSGSVTKEFLIAANGDLAMKNIWVYFGDANGVQTGTPIVFDGDTAGLSGDTLDYGTFENCIFDFMPCPAVTASGVICVRSKHFNGTFRNCYFRNCTDRHYMYYGRAVSFPFDVPGYHTDSCYFENCTFANMGYVYMQERNNYSDNVYFNHCTFYNILMFPLESGWWWKLNVNNCLFVNAWMMGYIPAQVARSATVIITPADSINFEVPFTDQDRHILFTHSAYYLDNWLVDWMRGGWTKDYDGIPWKPDPRITSVGNPYSIDLYNQQLFDLIPYPRPMLDSTALMYFDSTDSQDNKLYPYINRAELYDVSEIREAANPRLITVPLNLDTLKYFLWQKWGECCGSLWAWQPELSAQYIWPLSENLAYTNDTLLTAGMNAFPLGDLYRWFPDEYILWKQQEAAERERISQWLETGNDPGVIGINEPGKNRPVHFELYQNYPNPFNPTTTISFSIPRSDFITLTIYDILGRKIRTLVNGFRNAGKYSITVDARTLSTGIYYYTLVVGTQYRKTKKMLLLR